MRSADTSTTALTSMVTHRAAIHSMRLSGCCDTSSSTVARALGPAMAGTARGTISGSSICSGSMLSGGGNTMRKAIRNRITPPPICSASSERFITSRKRSPTNMKVSSSTKAIRISRRITHGLRSGATCLSALAKIGMLPTGSVISTSRMVAEAKV